MATNQLHNFGYFRASTSYELIPKKNPKKTRVAYHIQTGPLYLIDSLRYESSRPASIPSCAAPAGSAS